MPPRDAKRLSRRQFLQAGLAALATPAFSTFALRPGRLSQSVFPTRLLGRTGYHATILGLGGQILLQTPGVTDQAVALINRALDLGINYCDTAAAYHPSELYYGEAMQTRRREVFLATKTGDRTRDGAWRSLEQSLSNLRTDHVDLIQVHSLDAPADVDRIVQPDGALAAMLEARDQGLVRFIGVTGHTVPTLLAALDAFDFDTILVRVNPLDPVQGHVANLILPLAQSRNMGIIAMKVMSRGDLLASETPANLLRYTLSHPVSTAIVGCGNIAQLEQNVFTCRRFVPMSPYQRRRVERRLRG